MLKRDHNILKSNSFFLFGPRGSGKSTLISDLFKDEQILLFNLLDPELEDKFTLSPDLLRNEILAKDGSFNFIVVDEIQKCPKLLNSVHKLIVEKNYKFALTGSSARFLKKKKEQICQQEEPFQIFSFPLVYMN